MLCSSPAVSAMAVIHGRGATEASYVVVGSGGGGGGSGNPLSSSVAVMDLRRGEGPQVVSVYLTFVILLRFFVLLIFFYVNEGESLVSQSQWHLLPLLGGR